MWADTLSAGLTLALIMFGFVLEVMAPPRVDCRSGEWMPEPGICERVTPERSVQTPSGGWRDEGEPGERRGRRLHCTGGTRLRQRGTSAWCQR